MPFHIVLAKALGRTEWTRLTVQAATIVTAPASAKKPGLLFIRQTRYYPGGKRRYYKR